MGLKNIKIARVATISFFLVSQLKNQIDDLIAEGMDVSLISGEDEGMEVIRSARLKHIPVAIARDISILNDIKALIRLFFIFRKQQFQIVHSTTPKAGLLCAIAGYLARVPVRIHTFTGQAWANKTGVKRWILKQCDKIIMLLNTETYADSYSQIEYLKDEGVISSVDKIKVLGEGSLAGVDLDRFNADNYTESSRHIRTKYQIPENGKIILFLGRVTKDKGMVELLKAFVQVTKKISDVYLVIVGPHECKENDDLSLALQQACSTDRVIIEKYTSEPQKYIAVADFLCIPSYREGFGTVVIEAAAMAKPALGTQVQGLRDSVIDGVTGLLVMPQSVIELQNAMLKLLTDNSYTHLLGKAAYQRACNKFDSQVVSKLQIEEYKMHLNFMADKI